MQVRVARELLAKEIGFTLGVIDKRGTMPILNHVLVEAQAGGLTISATDLELAYQSCCPAEVKEPGAIALPAAYCHNLIKSLPGIMLDINSTDNHRLAIKDGEADYKFHGLDPEQFPRLPEVSDEDLAQVNGNLLAAMINGVIISTGDDLNYALQCLYLDQTNENGHHNLVSSDGHRLPLARRAFSLDGQLTLTTGVLIPRKGASEMARMADGEEVVMMGVVQEGKVIAIKTGQRTLAIRLMDRKFPEYQRIIPEKFGYGFIMECQAFLEILKRISLLSTERFKGVVLELTADSLEATFANPEVGEGRENLPLALVWGDAATLPVKIGFNARYLLEPLSVMTGEMVRFEVSGEGKPCRLMAENDPDYFSLVMPMDM
jgi:DNA polymerase III subunit beta